MTFDILGDIKSPNRQSWDRIPIEVEKQGTHSTSVPDGLSAALISTLATNSMEIVLHQDDLPAFETLIRVVNWSGKEQLPWKLQMHSVHIRGSSHYLKGSVRAYEVTDYNTLDLIIQPADASTRRRCQLSLPASIKLSERAACLRMLKNLLRPENAIPVGTQPQAEKCRDEFLDARPTEVVTPKKRTPMAKVAELGNSILRSKKRKVEVATAIGDYRRALSFEELRTILKDFWRKHAPADIAEPAPLTVNWLVSTVCLVSSIAFEKPNGLYELGEYGQLLYAEVLEERERVSASRRAERKREIGRELQRLEEKIGQLKLDLSLAEEAKATLEKEQATLASFDTEVAQVTL
ncbi:MAG TPA: hypothetical protein VLA04_04195 [Verrucomicrobiae bacterium]|nr:hypothetical protein [Verrucomicrobiae bacterium]